MIVYRLVNIIALSIVCINLYGQKIFFDTDNKEFNSIAMYKGWNDYWVSSKNGFIHSFNGDKKYYLNTDHQSGIKGDWIQSKIFEDSQGNIYSTNYEYLLILNKNSNKFESRKIQVNKSEVKSDYHISSIDTISNILRMRLGDNLVDYNYKANKVTEVICTSKILFQILNYTRDTIINIPTQKANGIEIVTKSNDDWKTNKLLTQFKFLKGIVLGNILYLLTEHSLVTYNLLSKKTDVILNFDKMLLGKDIVINKDDLFILFKNCTINKYKLIDQTNCQLVTSLNKDLVKLNSIFGIEIHYNQLVINTTDKGLQFINLHLFENCKQKQYIKYSKNNLTKVPSFVEMHKEISKQIKSKIHSTYTRNNYSYICSESGVYTYNIVTKDLSGPNTPIKDKIVYKLFFFDNEFHYTTSDGLLFKGQKNIGNIGITLDVFEDITKTLLSTYDGLVELSPNGINTTLWEGKVFKSVLGKNGSKWFLSDNGLFRMDTTCQVTKYCGSDISGTENASISFKNECEMVYLKYNNKVLEVSETYMDDQSEKPILSLRSIILDGKVIDNLSKISHSYGQINIQVNIEEKHCNDNHTIYYKVENIDQVWNKIKDNSARISRLPFGKYNIQIIAIGSNNVNSRMLELPLNILPPIYLRWWFVLLSGASLIYTGYSISRKLEQNRIRFKQIEFDKLQALQDQRHKLSQDLHDDLGSGLTKIKMLSSESNSFVKTTETKENINDISANMIESLRDMLWTLDNNNDNFESLVAKVRKVSHQMFSLSGITYSIEVFGQGNKLVGGIIRRNVILIIKETFANILKHSKASHVNIHLNSNDDIFSIKIQDNGQGLISNPKQINKGYGIQSIIKRVEQMQGTVSFYSTKGTQIDIEIPL